MRYYAAFLFFVVGTTAPVAAVEPMLRADVRGERIEGSPLFYSSTRMQILMRDGQLLEFRKSEARNLRKTASPFRGYSAAEMRRRLAKQFGRDFEVTGTGHYLVVHPVGEKNRWADRFEDLYRDFVHYFSVRGLALKKPDYPLVAVVWKDKSDFLKHASASGAGVKSNVLGYYSPMTNRVHLYDSSGGAQSGGAWQQNADTIIHEVTHQTAFNTGVHVRFSETPAWVVEGLGTLFEARGVYNSRTYPKRSDRINRGRFSSYRYRSEEFEPGFLKSLIASDRIFRTDVQSAYAQAWALTFYLVETQPRRYSAYLSRLAALKPVQPYTASARMADFVAVFGDDFRLQEARFQRFMAGMK